MSPGLFAAAPGIVDTQQPHKQDEVYLVVAGRAVLDIAGTRTPVTAGSIAYLPAGEPHRFVGITEDLRVVAVFSPPGP
jgi:mannose-6-phosphate isomerase-like protein (cupin superfamily)